MTHDRDYYRDMSVAQLVDAAREHGINPEMAIAMAERLSDDERRTGYFGHFKFNYEGIKTHA